MSFSNNNNRNVANRIVANARKDIATKANMYDNPASFGEPRSQQEYTSVEHPEVCGGSGNLAASSYDMGYEPKKVGGARTNTTRAKRVAKALGGEAPPMVVTSETTVVKPKRVRKAKTTIGDGSVRPTVAGGDMHDVIKTVGDVVSTAATVAPYVLPLVGLGKEGKPNKSMGSFI